MAPGVLDGSRPADNADGPRDSRHGVVSAGERGLYLDWMRQYILHRGKRHPQDMGIAEIRQYLGSSQFGPSAEPEQRV